MFRIIPNGENYREFVILRDGASVLFRAATPADVPAVEGLLKNLSRQSLQMRFMGGVATVSRRFIEDLCVGDPRDRYCILAIQGEEPDHKVIGLGNYISLGGHRRAEVAFMVADDHQGRGIGTLILERLAGVAAAYGYVGFEAEVLFENQAMINLFRSSGFEGRQAFEGGSIHVDFPVDGAAALRDRIEVRDRIAAANSLVPLLRPKAVAVVGASRDPSSMGSMIFRALLSGAFRGTAYPVNRQASSVNGVRAYPSLADLPETVDLAVIAVPAEGVFEVAEEAVRCGVRALIVISSGFAESGAEGATLQSKLVQLARSHGARLVGPNCLGLLNTHPDVSLNASLAPSLPPVGHVGFYSHSSALGLVILDYAVQRGLGFSAFVSAGNRADVSGNDLLQYWEEDPATDMALLYLETFGNPRKFARVARRFSRRKPILCVKSARSTAGRAAAHAHIAATAQSDQEVDTLFQQVGVIRANTLDEMFDVAVLLETQPLPAGNRCALVSNSGGVVTLCADACEANGLSVSPADIMEVGTLAPPEAFESAVREALERPGVDALLVIYACVGERDPHLFTQAIRRGVSLAEKTLGGPKPVLLCFMGTRGAIELGPPDPGAVTARHTFPSYIFPESAALALGRVALYAAYRRRPAGKLLWYEDARPASARQKAEALLAASPAPESLAWAEGEEARALLADFLIPVEAPSDNADYVQPDALKLALHTDAHFGPILELRREGHAPVLRITPLTDTDASEMIQALGLAPHGSAEELLGRISQLVEEIPWIHELHADLELPDLNATAGPAALSGDVRLGLKHI